MLLCLVAILAFTSFSAIYVIRNLVAPNAPSIRRGEPLTWILWMAGFIAYLLGQKYVKQGNSGQALLSLIVASGWFVVLFLFEFKKVQNNTKRN